MALYKEYVAKYPKEKEAHSQLGIVYQDSDPEKAIKEFNVALSLDPNYNEPLNQLGYLYLKLKEFTKALEYFQRLTAVNPESPNNWDSLGNAYLLAGRVAEAKAAYRKLSEKLPSIMPFNTFQYIYALEEDYEETLRLEDKILEVCTPLEREMVYRERGFYRGWVGDLTGSLNDLQRSEEMIGVKGNKAGVAQVMRLRVAIYLDQHELDAGRKSLEAYRAFYSENIPGNMAFHDACYQESLGLFECAEEKADRAELCWNEMEALIPKVRAELQESLKYRAGLLWAEVKLAQGRIDEVIRLFETTPPRPLAWDEKLYPPSYNTPFLRDVLARAYAKKGDLDKAITEYERLTVFDPKNEIKLLIHPKYHYRLGLLYEQKGQKVKAAEQYRKFLGLWKAADPKLPEMADAKKRLAALS